MQQILNTWKQYGYISPQKLYFVLQCKYPLSEITKIIHQQEAYQLHKQILKNPKKEGHITSNNPLRERQMDILDFQKFSTRNKNYRYILIIIDVFTRQLMAYPLKTKGEKDVSSSLSTMLRQTEKIPWKIQSDNGKEFLNKSVNAIFKRNNIFHDVSLKGDHRSLGIIDRISKTIKTMLYRHFTNNNTMFLMIW